MIELIVVIIILMAVVGSLRKPRTFAEAEYAAHLRQVNARRARITAVVILIFAGVVVGIGYMAGHP